MYEDSFWILFFLAALIGIVWGCFEVYFEPQRHSYLEDRVVDNRFFCCISGTSQVILSMCILASVILVYPSRELFYLWIILAALALCRGLKFIYAVSVY
jgi:hypothetical protein